MKEKTSPGKVELHSDEVKISSASTNLWQSARSACHQLLCGRRILLLGDFTSISFCFRRQQFFRFARKLIAPILISLASHNHALLGRHKFSQSAHENSIFHFSSPARHSEPSASAAESLFWINFGSATNWFMKMEFQTSVLGKVRH